jgi:hypothetical protein
MTVTINGSTGIAGVDGSAGTPSVQGSDTNTGVFFPAADTVGVSTGGTERMRIDTSGNVGIGTSSPAYKLDVNGTVRGRGDVYLGFVSGSQAGVWWSQTNYAVPAFQGLTSAGNVGDIVMQPGGGNLLVGATSGAYPLTVTNAGNNTLCGFTKSTAGGWIRESYTKPGSGVYYFDYFGVQGTGAQLGTISSNGTTMTYGTSSDVRMKENIVDAPSALDDLEAVKIKSFDWKSNGHHQKFGVIAQELIDVAPDAVQKGQTEEDMWGVGYANLVPMLVKAIQELKAQNDELKARVEALEAK